jgi:hypothetical protein
MIVSGKDFYGKPRFVKMITERKKRFAKIPSIADSLKNINLNKHHMTSYKDSIPLYHSHSYNKSKEYIQLNCDNVTLSEKIKTAKHPFIFTAKVKHHKYSKELSSRRRNIIKSYIKNYDYNE